MKETIGIILAFFCYCNTLWSQELISGLEVGDPIKAQTSKVSTMHKSGYLGSSIKAEAVKLPFFDDFSRSDILSNAWEGSNGIYINNTFVNTFITLGVATFDALNSDGQIYSHLISDTSKAADTLMSTSFDLSGKEKVYLSFFYKAGGLGHNPQKRDTFLLQFNDGVADTIHYVVEINDSTTLDTFKLRDWSTDTTFVAEDFDWHFYRVKLDSCGDFKFRFVNYVSLPDDPAYPQKKSNTDMWHVDYIQLKEYSNTLIDTMPNDIAFITPVPPFFHHYDNIPYDHLQADHIKSRIDLSVRNYSSESDERLNYSEYLVYDKNDADNFVQYQSELGYNWTPNTVFNYSYPTVFDFVTESEERPVTFESMFFIDHQEDEYVYEVNDTVKRTQTFFDYYSYCDSTSEMGYGLTGYATIGGKFVTLFKNYKPGAKLYYIDYYINATSNRLNITTGELDVDSDEVGQEISRGMKFVVLPYNVNKRLPDAEPLVSFVHELDNEFNGFGWNRIFLEEPVVIEDSAFYLGFEQQENFFVNLGYDVNSKVKGKNLVNLNGYWDPSNARNAVMMRAGFGNSELGNGQNYYRKTEIEKSGNIAVRIVPNPADDYIWFDGLDQGDRYRVNIINNFGQLVGDSYLYAEDQVEVGALLPGVYIVRIIDADTRVRIGRFVKK
ncbi:T9SS type A sorting domain-containing protein [Bacteroidales bacterium]|nr:T9SS type A sorting domain-containing protein [Bacteroidales bacterium]